MSGGGRSGGEGRVRIQRDAVGPGFPRRLNGQRAAFRRHHVQGPHPFLPTYDLARAVQRVDAAPLDPHIIA